MVYNALLTYIFECALVFLSLIRENIIQINIYIRNSNVIDKNPFKNILSVGRIEQIGKT